jgi:hypothetical protein
MAIWVVEFSNGGYKIRKKEASQPAKPSQAGRKEGIEEERTF